MVNNIKKVVNIYDVNEYTTMGSENTQVKLAQMNLKRLNQDTELPEKMLKSAIEAWSKGGQILTSICETVNDYCVFSSNKVEGENMKNYLKEVEFVDSIKNNDDFYSAIILKEDINCIWIVIEDATFNHNKKYLKSARVFKRENECEFNITIFNRDQIKDMYEQLQSYENYMVVNKDA